MLSTEVMPELAEKLYVYDVEQGGWEQEPNGIRSNMEHVLTHLAKDITGKDFNDKHTVRTAIAPDLLQYGLRFRRWAGLKPEEVLPTDEQVHTTQSLESRFSGIPMHQVVYFEAVATTARGLHDLGHDKERAVAEANLPLVALNAARLLIYSAQLQSEQYDFDLVESFANRLTTLRKRFGIPQPE